MSLDPTLSRLIQNLIKHFNLSELVLQNIDHVPCDLLQGSKVKSLGLRDTSISYSNTDGHHSTDPLPIQSLIFEGVTSTVEDINGLVKTYPGTTTSGSQFKALPHLVELIFTELCPSMLEMMNQVLEYAPAPQSLTIELASPCHRA